MSKRTPPTKFNASRARALVERISQGATLTEAASVAGVHRATVRAWLLRARQPDAPRELAEFAAAMRDAELARKDLLIDQVAKGMNIAGMPDWKASAWLLERLYPEEFARRTIQERVVRSELEQLLEDVEPHMSHEAWGELLRACAKVMGLDNEAADPTARTVVARGLPSSTDGDPTIQ